jgi:hypothetical protein
MGFPAHATLSHASHAATGINASTHSLLSISLFRFLTGEGGRGRKVVGLSCCTTDFWTNKTRGSLDLLYVRDTRGCFDGEPTVRRPGSSTRTSTASTCPRKQRSIQKNSHHSFYVIWYEVVETCQGHADRLACLLLHIEAVVNSRGPVITLL